MKDDAGAGTHPDAYRVPPRLSHRDWLRSLRGWGLGETWEAKVLAAPHLPLKLDGIQRDAWLAALHGRATAYRRDAADMLRKEPVASDYRRLIGAATELFDALRTFGTGPIARAPSLQFELVRLKAWAEIELERRQSGGRPANELARRAIRELLLLYWHGFGRKPSRAPAGPACRFIAAFFDGIRGTEVVLTGDWRPERGEEEPPRRHLPCPPASAIPDMVRHALPSLLAEPLPTWWGNLRLERPTFCRLNAR